MAGTSTLPSNLDQSTKIVHGHDLGYPTPLAVAGNGSSLIDLRSRLDALETIGGQRIGDCMCLICELGEDPIRKCLHEVVRRVGSHGSKLSIDRNEQPDRTVTVAITATIEAERREINTTTSPQPPRTGAHDDDSSCLADLGPGGTPNKPGCWFGYGALTDCP